MPKLKYNSLKSEYLYHITQSTLNDSNMIWQPRISGSNRCDLEPKIARICFSTNITGCFLSLGNCLDESKTIHVLRTLNKVKYYKPSTKQVLDVNLTNEVWRLSSTKLLKIGELNPLDLHSQDSKFFNYLNFNPGHFDSIHHQAVIRVNLNNLVEKFNYEI